MSTFARRVVPAGAAALLLVASAVVADAARGPRCFGKRATIVGTGKRDRIRGTQGPDVIAALGGKDRVNGRGGNDLICGGAGDDTLTGGGGNDKIDAGRGGGESLIGNAGDDLLDGGPGRFEDVRFVTARAGITVDLRTGVATGEGSDTLVSIDQLITSNYDDVVYGDDDDSHFGNFLLTLGGNDTVYGLGGNDLIGGGDGNDTLDGGGGIDMINNIYGYEDFGQSTGGVNVDFPEGTITGHGSDTIAGFEGSTGTDSDDVFLGDDGDNEFTQMYGGADTASGGEGNDLIDVGDGNDSAFGGGGTDLLGHLDHSAAVTVDLGEATATSEAGTDQVEGFEDVLGSFFDDTLTGDNQANVIEGDVGNDTLFGLQGDDTLIGDVLEFSFDPDSDTAHGAQGNDVCLAETETECESDPAAPQARRSYRPSGYTYTTKW